MVSLGEKTSIVIILTHDLHFPDCAWEVLLDDNKHIGKMFKTNTVNIKNQIRPDKMAPQVQVLGVERCKSSGLN